MTESAHRKTDKREGDFYDHFEDSFDDLADNERKRCAFHSFWQDFQACRWPNAFQELFNFPQVVDAANFN